MELRTEADFLDELEALFLREGFAQLTVGDIAKKLRCSRRRLYTHAETKEELFALVLERIFSRIRNESVAMAEGEADYLDKIRVNLEAGEVAAKRASSQFLTDIDADPAARDLFDGHMRLCVNNLVEIMEQGIEAGALVRFNTRVIAEALFAAAQHLRDPQFLDSLSITYEDALIELGRLIRKGVAAD